MRLRHLVLVAAFVTLLVPVGANASTLLDRNAHGVTLKVNSKGQAVVSYTARGKKWNVLAWGAVNAIAPSAGQPAGRLQARLLGRLGHLQEGRLEDGQELLRDRTTARRSPGA